MSTDHGNISIPTVFQKPTLWNLIWGPKPHGTALVMVKKKNIWNRMFFYLLSYYFWKVSHSFNFHSVEGGCGESCFLEEKGRPYIGSAKN